MVKLFVFAAIVLLLCGCKGDANSELSGSSSSLELAFEQLPEPSQLNSKASLIIKDWPEYVALDNSFNTLYTVSNEEDLRLVVEDLIEKQKLLEDSTYPEALDKPQVKSRQKVLKTYILKLKAALEYRIDTQEPAREMIMAYNAMRNQCNVIVNNTLDTKLIFEE